MKAVLKLSVCILSSGSISVEIPSCKPVKVLELASSLNITNSHPALEPRTPPSQLGPCPNEHR